MDEAREIRYLFEPVARDSWVSWHALSEQLCAWGRRLDEAGLTPEAGGASLGNLSFRTTQGMVITPSRTRLKSGLSPRDLVEVVRIENVPEAFKVHYLGDRPPSSDSLLHWLIYAARPDVVAVFHGHDDVMLAAGERLGIPYSIDELPFGTVEDAHSTVAGLGAADAVLRQGHGFVTVGRDLDRAGRLALELHQRAQELG